MRFVSIIIFVNVTNRYDSVDVIMNVGAIPSDITALVAEGIKNIWHNVKLRGRGYSRANEIVSYAEKSVGLTDGTDAGREAIKWYAEQILKLDEQLAVIESVLHEKCREIPYAENILAINGVGENILAGILAEMGDISRFDDVKEIQKLSGMGLVACSSGKHKGQTKISHRGRKILRVIYTILKTGTTYDPQKLLKDIKHPAASQAPMAA